MKARILVWLVALFCCHNASFAQKEFVNTSVRLSGQDLLQTEDVDPEPVPQKAHRFTRGAEYYRRGKKKR